nr:MAG TPA: hypothetical protein [Caudoviricetes sp.]
MRYPSTKNLAGYYRTRAGAVVKAEKRNGMWTVHVGSRDVVIISDDAFYSLFSGIV